MLDSAAAEAVRLEIDSALQSLTARIQLQRAELNRLAVEYMELVRLQSSCLRKAATVFAPEPEGLRARARLEPQESQQAAVCSSC